MIGQTAFGAGVRGEVYAPGSNSGSGVVGVAAGCEFGNANAVGVGGSGRGTGSSIGNKTGVLGITDGSLGVGVQGWAQGSGTGIRGSSNGGGGPDFGGSGVGVDGRSGSGYGVYGLSQSGPGVFGGSNSHYGVYANSNEGTGVFATAPQKAVWGRTVSATGIGVFGQATATGGKGVYGYAPTQPNTWAGYFEGNVYISGGLAGVAPISSMAQAPDGSLRTLYSMDSAEPVVEDFGESTLAQGQAVVTLDRDFAAVAEGGAYQVFLTEYGDLGTLFVAGRTPTSFAVRSRTGASGGFGYRVVATRKGMAGKRLEKLTPPRKLDAGELEPPKLPKPPETPPAGPEIPATGVVDPPKPGSGGPQRGGPPIAR